MSQLPPYIYTIVMPQKVVCDNYAKMLQAIMVNAVELKFCLDLGELIEEYSQASLMPKKLPDDYPDTFRAYSYNYKALMNFKNGFAPYLKIVRFWGVSVQE